MELKNKGQIQGVVISSYILVFFAGWVGGVVYGRLGEPYSLSTLPTWAAVAVSVMYGIGGLYLIYQVAGQLKMPSVSDDSSTRVDA